MYQTNDTVRLKATFRTFEDELLNLTNLPTIKIYNSDEEVIDSVDGTLLTNPSEGVYYYDYTLPSTAGTYIYEFAGITEHTTVSRRGIIKVGFL